MARLALDDGNERRLDVIEFCQIAEALGRNPASC